MHSKVFSLTNNKGAVRTLTRESLLGLRQAALKPDLSTCRRIALLGCIGRRRGCRAGCNKTKHKQQTGIPVIVGRRQTVLRVPVAEVRQRVLTLVKTQPSVLSYPQYFPTFSLPTYEAGLFTRRMRSLPFCAKTTSTWRVSQRRG